MKKTKVLLGLLIALLLLMAPMAVLADEDNGYDYDEDVVAAEENGEEEAPAADENDDSDGAVTITIFHTNDMHGRFLPAGNIIGIDTIAAILAATDNAFLVDAGDTIHGTPFVNLGEGFNAMRLMDMAGYSFMTPGNHDFNFGVDRLLELEAMVGFELLSANVTRDGELVFNNIAIAQVGGVTVGFFGISYPGTPRVTHPNNVYGLTFGNAVTAAQEAVDVLQSEGVDVIVALTHLGEDGTAWGLQVASQVWGIDVIIDGHSHTLHEEGRIAYGTLMAQAGAHGRYLGRVDIVVYGGEILSITASVITVEYARENFEPVAAVTALMNEMAEELQEALSVVVGYSPVTMYGDSPEHRQALRSSEVPLGNLVASSMLYASGADFALANSGGIRTHLHAGEITRGHIVDVMPFNNYAVVVAITPAVLRDALENGVSNLPGDGRFPQVAGFSFSFDASREVGDRVLSIVVDGQELDLNDTTTIFTLVINDFLQAGGDGYTMFMGLNAVGEFANQDELLTAYINVIDLNTVGVEGRIIDLTPDVVEEPEVEEPNLYEELPLVEEPVEEEPAVEEPAVVEEPVVEETPVVVVAGTATVVNCWYLNVRRGPGVSHSAFAVLRVGTVVNVLETRGNWHLVETDDVSGWVFGRYLEIH